MVDPVLKDGPNDSYPYHFYRYSVRLVSYLCLALNHYLALVVCPVVNWSIQSLCYELPGARGKLEYC